MVQNHLMFSMLSNSITIVIPGLKQGTTPVF